MFNLNFLKSKIFFLSLIFLLCTILIPLQTNFQIGYLTSQNSTKIINGNYRDTIIHEPELSPAVNHKLSG
ncbi:hypothetical protein, partial [Candidatus Hodarchaeum mangrovi]